MSRKTNILGIGQRMPYKNPDGMFDEIERNVLRETGCEKKTRAGYKWLAAACAAAATLALTITFSWHRQMTPEQSFTEVSQAFANLDQADQAFLSEIYKEDTFLIINYQ